MDEKYSALFTPWKIGDVEIKNRIVQCSMGGTSLFGWLEPCHFDKEAANFLLNRAQDGKTVDATKEIAVQVNGKVRDTITISIDEDEDAIKEKAMSASNVLKHIEGKEIVKVIVIKGKIVNIVVK